MHSCQCTYIRSQTSCKAIHQNHHDERFFAPLCAELLLNKAFTRLQAYLQTTTSEVFLTDFTADLEGFHGKQS